MGAICGRGKNCNQSAYAAKVHRHISLVQIVAQVCSVQDLSFNRESNNETSPLYVVLLCTIPAIAFITALYIIASCLCLRVVRGLDGNIGSSNLSPAELPDAQSSALHLTHPTPGECQVVWRLSSLAWTDALSLPQYLEKSAYLTTVPLARDRVMTNWILTDKNLPPGQRPILCSCETFRKRAFISDRDGNVSEKIYPWCCQCILQSSITASWIWLSPDERVV